MPILRSLLRPSPSKARPGACDELWKLLTERANQALATGNPAFARSLYDAALTEAERLMELAGRDPAHPAVALAPMLHNISCHNLAELCIKETIPGAAREFFERAFECLVRVSSAPELPSELRVSAARHLQVATAALVNHLCEQELFDAAEAFVVRANRAVASASPEVAEASPTNGRE